MKFVVSVAMVALVVILVAKVLVWAEAPMDMLVGGLVITTGSVRVDVLADVATALEFAVTVSRSSADVVVDVLTDALADVMIAVLLAVGVANVLAGVNVSILAVVMTVLEFTMSMPLGEGFGC